MALRAEGCASAPILVALRRSPCGNGSAAISGVVTVSMDLAMKPLVIAVASRDRFRARRTTRPCRSRPPSRSRARTRLRGRRLARPHPRPQPRRKLLLRSGALSPGAGGRAKALPRHDRAVLHRRARPRPSRARLALDLKPDMASLSTGSVNFPTIVYENPPPWSRTSPAR